MAIKAHQCSCFSAPDAKLCFTNPQFTFPTNWGTNLPSSNRGTPGKILQAPQPSIPHHNSISACATTSSQGVLYMHAMRPSLLSSNAEAMICFPQQPVTLSSSLLWFGSNPTTQHHVGRTFLTRSSPSAAFLPRWAVLSPSSSHVAGRAAPTCPIPLPRPSAGATESGDTPCAKLQETALASSSFQTMPRQSSLSRCWLQLLEAIPTLYYPHLDAFALFLECRFWTE